MLTPRMNEEKQLMFRESIICNPRRHGTYYAPLPLFQEPLVIHINDKVLVVAFLDLIPHNLNNIWIQRQLSQPCPVVPHLPLLVCLVALDPIGALTGNDIHGKPSKEVPFNQQASVVVPWDCNIKHVKQCREKITVPLGTVLRRMASHGSH